MPPRITPCPAALRTRPSFQPWVCCRFYNSDGRTRLSNWWAPSAKGYNYDFEKEGSHGLLVKAGFIRQAYAGYFQLMPLGLRVQEKLEKLIQKHMGSLHASKIALSSVSSVDLWKKTGRLSSETVQLQSRSKQEFLLCPTHEEEVTKLVKEAQLAEKDLPLRLYQISRKYRDEMRPRQGLLRTREFLMKDLYTFDVDEKTALATYEEVRQAYMRLFAELQIPFTVAEADSGDIGGTYSHEFHYLSDIGEDTLWKCNSCDYVANDELAHTRMPSSDSLLTIADVRTHSVDISLDGDKRQLVLHYPKSRPDKPQDQDLPSVFSAKRHVASVFDATVKSWSSVEDKAEAKSVNPLYAHLHRRLNIVDARVAHLKNELVPELERESALVTDIMPLRDGDACPRCEKGHLSSQRAIELGHTFHLGTKYSAALDAGYVAALDGPVVLKNFVMGCHGIGISRMIAAIAAIRCDTRGMSWPRVAAPWEVAVLYEHRMRANQPLAEELYDELALHGKPQTVIPGQPNDLLDVVLDDRVQGSIVQKMTDADFVGYPVIVVVGSSWKKNRLIEIQCRQLGVKANVAKEKVVETVRDLLKRC